MLVVTKSYVAGISFCAYLEVGASFSCMEVV